MNKVIVATTNFTRINDCGDFASAIWFVAELNFVIGRVDDTIWDVVWIDERFQK